MHGGFGNAGPNLSQSRLKSFISVDLHTQTVSQVLTVGDKFPGVYARNSTLLYFANTQNKSFMVF